MGYCLSTQNMNKVILDWSKDYLIYAPKTFVGGHCFSDKDLVRYAQIDKFEDIVFDKKSDYSFKEVLLPLSQTLFYYTEDSVKEPSIDKKGAIIFLRSCDLHAVKRLDEIYLHNGFEDYYYNRLRTKVKFVLMGCQESFDSCFCVDMGTNKTELYDCSMDFKNENIYINNQNKEWDGLFEAFTKTSIDVVPAFVKENATKVNIPENLTTDVTRSKMWDEYDTRCINCGRCNFVCPTCTCFTMQDIFYTDNGKAGERRRVWASCMVDGFTDVAGGGRYRQKNGQRMRFRVLHKVYDYKKRYQYHMCTGCGRCDDVCPEYISFSNCINKLQGAMEEVTDHAK